MWVDYGWIRAIYGWFVCEPGGEVTIRGRDHRHPSRWESLNNQLASHTGVSLENQSGPSCHISKPVCKLHRCQLELAATLHGSAKRRRAKPKGRGPATLAAAICALVNTLGLLIA